jgi:hypothetical protein
MDCLNGAIGLSASCSDAVYPMGYVDDLEGISLKSLSAMESGKYIGYQNMIDSKMRIVGSKVSEKLGMLLGDVVIDQSVQSIIPIGFSEDSLTGATGTPGLRITKKATALTALFVPRIYFKSATEVNGLVITITDGHNSMTVEVDAEADEEVPIDTNFTSSNLEITISYNGADPSQTIEPYTGNINPYHRYGCITCSWGGNHYLKMTGIDFEGNESSKWYGIRADVLMICDRSKMVCLFANKNPWIFKYMLGVEIANESVATDRMNFFALNTKDWWREMSAKWQYESDKLWDDAGVSIKKILQKAEPSCFICTGSHVRYSIG